jgi:outer membrane receptor protein involved in Fe transport
MAGGVPTLDTVEVQAGVEDLIGTADSANQGTVLKQQLERRTTYRPGELLEATPGLVVSQHSGEGKANQYYLRGFNLDHGTDLRTTVDGMPVNQRSHGHGQGWTDINFIIPEVVASLQYKKGPYFADEGDFSSAGAAQLNYLDTLPNGIAQLGVGENGYRRAIVADSFAAAQGNVLYAGEYMHNDGPWTNPDDYRKVNGVLRYSEGTAQSGFDVTAMAYRGIWNATDQIPKRAVDSGQLSRWDAIDASDGGDVYRYSLSGAWHRTAGNGVTRANAYVINTKMQLFSNFGYFLDDPDNGDQFQQNDHRITYGANASHGWLGSFARRDAEYTVGVQYQGDSIFNGLYHTAARQRLSTTREDHIFEDSLGVYGQVSVPWTEKFRTVLGLRGDIYSFTVDSDNASNSGSQVDSIVNPKASVIFGPWHKTEYYVNLGGGFHSNDARGATIRVDPSTGDAVSKVSPLVRSKGYELGLRSAIVPGLQTTLAVFQLDIDSELLFIGDAGTTEASRPSRRRGVEWANFYLPVAWLTVDFDLAYTQARFTDSDAAGDRIPGAAERVASLAASVDKLGGFFGGLNWRYFGPRPLIEDNSVRSKATSIVNGQVGYNFTKRLRLSLEGFNLFDEQASSIDYYYASRLPGEAAEGIEDIHFHPVESRTFRVNVAMGL